MENHIAAQCYNAAATLSCSVLDVLDAWGEHGRSREELIAKCQAIAAESNVIDREEMDKQREKTEAAQAKARSPRR